MESVSEAGGQGNSLHVKAVGSAASAAFNMDSKFITGGYYCEFRLKVVSNPNYIIVNVYPGFERTQLNIRNGGTQIQLPVQKSGTTKVDKSVTIAEKIPNYSPLDWHTWKIVTVNRVQTIYIDDIAVFSDYTQFPWNNNTKLEFHANATNEFFVDYAKFGAYEFTDEYLLNTSFDNLNNWSVNEPVGSTVRTESVDGNNALRLTVPTGGTASNATYNFPSKYDMDTVWEFRLKVPKNTGTILMQSYTGFVRSYIEVINNGNSLRLKDSAGANVEVNITTKITDYDPTQWHLFRIEKIGNYQTVYVDNVAIVQCTVQDNTTAPGINYWANGSGASGNEIYVDDCVLKLYSQTIPMKYGKASMLYDLSTDSVEKGVTWTTNADDFTNSSLIASNDLISLNQTDISTVAVYANRGLSNTSDRMSIEFDMQLPQFGKFSQVMVRNGSRRIQVEFYENSIKYRDNNAVMQTVATGVGTGWHNWRFVMWDAIGMIYADDTLVAKFLAHPTTESKLFQLACASNGEGTAAEMNVKNIKCKQLGGSVIIDIPAFNSQTLDQESITADVGICNYSSYDADNAVLVAGYGAGNTLESILIDESKTSKESCVKKAVVLPLNEDISYVRAFVFKSLSGIEPLTATKIVPEYN